MRHPADDDHDIAVLVEQQGWDEATMLELVWTYLLHEAGLDTAHFVGWLAKRAEFENAEDEADGDADDLCDTDLYEEADLGGD